MAEKIATRESYGKTLAALGDTYDFVVLDADLAGATKTSYFKKKFPDRFFDCGIAEGNMMSVAAGIAHYEKGNTESVNGCFLRIEMETKDFSHVNFITKTLRDEGFKLV